MHSSFLTLARNYRRKLLVHPLTRVLLGNVLTMVHIVTHSSNNGDTHWSLKYFKKESEKCK